MHITIIGLGPGQREQLTLAVWQRLETANELYLRTRRHPLVETLDIPIHSFDDLYDSAEDFDTLYQRIAEQVITLGKRPQGVIYGVPGHPMVGEKTTQLILKAAKEAHIPITIMDGMSFIEPCLSALEIDGMEGLQILDAIDIARMYHPPLNPDQPALIAQVYSRQVASDLKLTLMNQYPDDYPVILLHAVGTADVQKEHIPLYEIDRSPHIAHLTTL